MPSREQVAEVLTRHYTVTTMAVRISDDGRRTYDSKCQCGTVIPWSAGSTTHHEHLADALMPLFEQAVEQARNEALEEAAGAIEAERSLQCANGDHAAYVARRLKTGGGG